MNALEKKISLHNSIVSKSLSHPLPCKSASGSWDKGLFILSLFHLLPLGLPHLHAPPQDVASSDLKNPKTFPLAIYLFKIQKYFPNRNEESPKFMFGPLIWKLISWKQSPVKLPSTLSIRAEVINNITIQQPGRGRQQRFQIFFWMMNYLIKKREKKTHKMDEEIRGTCRIE